MAQLVTANPKLFSKSPDQELSESVVKVSGNSKFTRLNIREQCLKHFNFLFVGLIFQSHNDINNATTTIVVLVLYIEL